MRILSTNVLCIYATLFASFLCMNHSALIPKQHCHLSTSPSLSELACAVLHRAASPCINTSHQSWLYFHGYVLWHIVASNPLSCTGINDRLQLVCCDKKLLKFRTQFSSNIFFPAQLLK